MNARDLQFFRKWFSDYVRSFYSENSSDQKNIELKESHTARVCENMRLISGRLGLGAAELMIAESAALFHDIGRFQQYARYKTFRDAFSINHGELGAEILKEERILVNIPDVEQDSIIQSVRFHNAFSLPDLGNPMTVLCLKLVRDADKLDIFKIYTEHLESSPEERASAVLIDLPESPGCSPDVLARILQKKPVSISLLKNQNDFKLLQLSWIYDVNFASTLKEMAGRNYAEWLVSHLPETEEIREAIKPIMDYLKKKLSGAV